MNEHDVIRHMGRFPDKITSTMMGSKKWKCSNCKDVFEFDTEVRPPAPCPNCGKIFFEKLR